MITSLRSVAVGILVTLVSQRFFAETRLSANQARQEVDLDAVRAALSSLVDLGSSDPLPAPDHQSMCDLREASLEWLQEIMNRPGEFAPEVGAYVADRMFEEVFAGKLARALEPFTALREAAEGLAAAGTACRLEDQARERIRYTRKPVEEQRGLVAKLDISGKREAARLAAARLLSRAGGLTPAGSALKRFLKDDLDVQSKEALTEQKDTSKTLAAMRDGYWHALSCPAPVEQAYHRLEDRQKLLEPLQRGLIRKALAPGRTPRSLMRDDATAFVDAQAAYDLEFLRLVIVPGTDPQTRFALVAEYERGSFRRRQEFLRAGRRVYAFDMLVQTARAYYAARLFGRRTDAEGDGYLVQSSIAMFHRAAETISKLEQYRDRWLADSRKAGALYAAVEVDSVGTPVWRVGSWVLWEWLANEDVQDLADLARVATLNGRRWLLPPGVKAGSVAGLVSADLAQKGAREIVVGVDLNENWRSGGQ
jgi:hypothetical protein